MTLIKGVNSSYDLQEMRQVFLTVGIKLTNEELFQLLEYQYRICQKLNWVETDNKKFEEIVLPFLHSGFIHTGNYMILLKKIIYIYYTIRKKFDYHTTDDTISNFMCQEFIRYSGLNLESLLERTIRIIAKEGGQYRVEQSIPVYR